MVKIIWEKNNDNEKNWIFILCKTLFSSSRNGVDLVPRFTGKRRSPTLKGDIPFPLNSWRFPAILFLNVSDLKTPGDFSFGKLVKLSLSFCCYENLTPTPIFFLPHLSFVSPLHYPYKLCVIVRLLSFKFVYVFFFSSDLKTLIDLDHLFSPNAVIWWK